MGTMTNSLAGAAMLLGLAGCGADSNGGAEGASANSGQAVSLRPAVTHETDPMKGRELFVEKGCVICHAVNGVGGKAAPALDAQIGGPAVDPLDFAARMWLGAPAMIELQAIELGYTIYLTADDIANLAAFAADRDAQKSLTVDDLPEDIRSSLLDERFWEMEDWDGFLRDGQEGEFPEQTDGRPEEVE